jgi:hypothetical protein
MDNNAVISSRLKDLLDVMDARTTINIFIEDEETKTEKRLNGCKVFELLADRDFLRTYGNCDVVGLNCGIVTNILISKEA